MAMQDGSVHPFMVLRGSLVLVSDFEDEGPMWTSEGPRLVQERVTFERPFRVAPEVLVSLEMWDFDSGPNIRGDLSAAEIGAHGFSVMFKAWGDSRVARLRVGWIAIGTTRYADDWHV